MRLCEINILKTKNHPFNQNSIIVLHIASVTIFISLLYTSKIIIALFYLKVDPC